MITTRNYRNSFIVIMSDEEETTCYNKVQAIEMLEEIEQVKKELEEFIEVSED